MAAPPSEKPYHHGDLRRALLEEALAVIEERGHLDFTLREVARRLGVSHGAPYRHFADKRALLTALSAEGALEMASQIESALTASGLDIRARFLAAGFAYVRFAIEHRARYQVMFSGEVDERDASMQAAKEASFGLLLRFVKEAQGAGAFPSAAPVALAHAVFAMHHGLASLATVGTFGVGAAEALRPIIDEAHARLLDGLMVRPLAVAGRGRKA